MAERTKHISRSFDAALYGLKNDVLMMSSLTDRIFQMAFEALLTTSGSMQFHWASSKRRSMRLIRSRRKKASLRSTVTGRSPTSCERFSTSKIRVS
jgi:hypothetical protein